MHFHAGKGSQGPERGSWPDPGHVATSFSRVLSQSALGFHVSLSAVWRVSALDQLQSVKRPWSRAMGRGVAPVQGTSLYSGVKGKRPGSRDAMISKTGQGPGLMELTDLNKTITHTRYTVSISRCHKTVKCYKRSRQETMRV